MNILDKMDDLLCACESTFEHDMTNVDNMLRVADMQFECTNNDIELAIMKEAAYDDVHMMFEEANEKFSSKVKAAAQKAIDAIKSFFEKLISGLKDLQTKAKEKLMSINVKNPFVGSKKVKGPDKEVVKAANEVNGVAADAFVLMKPQVSSDRNFFRTVTPYILLAGVF